MLIDQAEDETAPRSINVYLVELGEIDATSQLAGHGEKFKVGTVGQSLTMRIEPIFALQQLFT